MPKIRVLFALAVLAALPACTPIGLATSAAVGTAGLAVDTAGLAVDVVGLAL